MEYDISAKMNLMSFSLDFLWGNFYILQSITVDMFGQILRNHGTVSSKLSPLVNDEVVNLVSISMDSLSLVTKIMITNSYKQGAVLAMDTVGCSQDPAECGTE